MVALAISLGFVDTQEMGIVLVVMASTPAAVTLVTLVTVEGKAEEKISSILFFQYLTAILSLPCCLILYQAFFAQ